MGAPNHLRWQYEQRRAAERLRIREEKLRRIQLIGWWFAWGAMAGAGGVIAWWCQ